MDEIEFKIRFITPLLIHGADSRAADSVGLTGKSLRGCWRFWFRALVGGLVKGITKEKLFELESKIFGSSDEKVGARFRMLVEPISPLKPIPTEIDFSQRSIPFQGYKEGSEFSIRINPRSSMDNGDIKILLSSIWLWANLGAIGQRARRGFGSPVIEFDGNSNPFEKYFKDSGLPIKQTFKDRKEISDHLISGIKIVWDTLFGWCKGCNISSFNPPVNDKNSKASANPSFFILSSLKQITVADKGIDKDVKVALNKIHGSNTCSDMGTANPRKASPVFIRLHSVKDEFYPVVTWSEPKNKGCARSYIINNCNCIKYLDGSSV
jgi:CRISPR type III-B/RAMP module RAMP protein Cmr1